MKKHLFGVAILMSMVLAGSLAFAVTIDEIQTYTAAGVPASPYAGQTVTVTGTMLEFHKYSTGSGYLIGPGGPGISLFGGTGDVVAIGDIVSVTGTVATFSGEIQINVTNYTLITAGPNALTPEAKTIPQLLSTYENVGHYGVTTGTVARKTTSGTPPLVTANVWIKTGTPTSITDSLLVYFDKDCQIDVSGIVVGDLWQFSGPIVVFNAQIELKPVLQTDIVKNPGGDLLPVITNINCSNWAPLASTPVTVSADINDDHGVTSAYLFYRDSDGVTPGGWNQVAMTHGSGASYSASIPAGHSQSQVNFYIQTTDTAAQTVKNPGNAPTSFFTFAVGFTSIYAMQTVDPNAASQSNNFNGKPVNVKGVVTAGSGAATNAASKFVIQELAVNPATSSYAFGGVLVYEGSGKYPYYQGDVVEVGGTGGEYFGLTEMLPANAEAVNLIDFGHALPVPAVVATRVLNDDFVGTDGIGALGEAWESVWVRTPVSAVMDTTGLAQYHEYYIANTRAVADTVMVDPYPVLAYSPKPGDLVTVTSFVDYEFGRYKLRPMDDSYITLNGTAAVGNDVPTIDKLGGFKSISPNPFNPQTNIKFVVNKDNLVQVNVYNIRGEKVRTLIQDRLPANEYNVVWNGTDDSGKSVASGSYFARLRIGKDVMQVRQMQLVK